MKFPSDTHAERALISAIVQEPKNVELVAGTVTRADFYDSRYGQLFQTLATSFSAGMPVNSLVGLAAIARDLDPEFRDFEFWRGLNDGVSHWHATYYADIVRRHSIARRLAIIATELISEVDDCGTHEKLPDADAMLSGLRAKLDQIGSGGPVDAVSLAQASQDALAAVKSARKPSGAQIACTGLIRLDSDGATMRAGTLTILAARPAGGKSAMAMQIALHNAGKGRPVLFASCEMRQTELAMRVLAGLTGVSFTDALDGRTSESDVVHLSAAVESVESLPVRIVQAAGMDVERLCSLIRLEHSRGRCALAVVDYLQLLRPARDDARSDRHLQVAGMTRRLKALANETGVALLVLSQLSRAADGETPQLSHLRESGAIEQDADGVWFLHRPDTYQAEVAFIAAKVRNDAPFTRNLTFDGPRFTFRDDSANVERVGAFDDFNSGGSL